MFTSYFARFDARKKRERAERRAARRAAKAAAVTPAAPAAPAARAAPVQTDNPLPSDNVFPLLYTGAEHHAQQIDENEFPSCYRDPATRNWRESIARNERLRQQREQKG